MLVELKVGRRDRIVDVPRVARADNRDLDRRVGESPRDRKPADRCAELQMRETPEGVHDAQVSAIELTFEHVPRFRARLSANYLIGAASVIYALSSVLIVVVPNPVLAVIVLLPAGAAWIAVLSDINAELQLFLPAWVRARGLSVYLMVLFGAQGVGALVWGAIAEPLGVRGAFLIAAAAMVAGLATMRFWPFLDTAGMERRTMAYWPEPHLAFDAKLDSGPVVVRSTYTIASEKEQSFLEAMAHLRQSRLRTGATQWGLFRDGEVAHRFVELYVVPSWDEHLRQHRYRITGTDHEFEERADMLSDPPPEVSHLIAVDDLP